MATAQTLRREAEKRGVANVFVVRHVADVPARRFALAPEEVLLLNPNTGTLSLFRSRIDAEITVGIYRRHPVLTRDWDDGGNPWALRLGTVIVPAELPRRRGPQARSTAPAPSTSPTHRTRHPKPCRTCVGLH